MIECVSRVTSVLNYGRDESSGVLLLAAGDAAGRHYSIQGWPERSTHGAKRAHYTHHTLFQTAIGSLCRCSIVYPLVVLR